MPLQLTSKSILILNPYSCTSHPLVHSGRHFGRTVHALCNVNSLITNGVLRLGELAEQPEESFTAE